MAVTINESFLFSSASNPNNYSVYGAYGSYGSYPDVISAPAPAPAPAAVPPVLPASNPGNFVAISSRSGDVNLHLRPISASNLKFYVGKPTSTYCPLADCSGCTFNHMKLHLSYILDTDMMHRCQLHGFFGSPK